jgi:hypothetical protein
MAETKDTKKKGYKAGEHADAIHEQLLELSTAESSGSAVDEAAIAKEALDFHDAYRAVPWYALLLEVSAGT